MHAKTAKRLIRSEMNRFPLTRGWELIFDSRTLTRMGECRYDEQEIHISNWVYELNKRPLVLDVARHEIAHALVGPNVEAHGREFRIACYMIGCRALRGTAEDYPGLIIPKFRYISTCADCGRTHQRYVVSHRTEMVCACGCDKPLSFSRISA